MSLRRTRTQVRLYDHQQRLSTDFCFANADFIDDDIMSEHTSVVAQSNAFDDASQTAGAGPSNVSYFAQAVQAIEHRVSRQASSPRHYDPVRIRDSTLPLEDTDDVDRPLPDVLNAIFDADDRREASRVDLPMTVWEVRVTVSSRLRILFMSLTCMRRSSIQPAYDARDGSDEYSANSPALPLSLAFSTRPAQTASLWPRGTRLT
jgi:hypothetical protein